MEVLCADFAAGDAEKQMSILERCHCSLASTTNVQIAHDEQAYRNFVWCRLPEDLKVSSEVQRRRFSTLAVQQLPLCAPNVKVR